MGRWTAAVGAGAAARRRVGIGRGGPDAAAAADRVRKAADAEGAEEAKTETPPVRDPGRGSSGCAVAGVSGFGFG